MGIKREFSVAKTPQQTRVAERKNRTLIEAARTMLADSKLPTTFWVEAVNTVCYVQNRVLVIKPHNKIPYELFLDRKPVLSFMRACGCPIIILNTIDHLAKFDGNADERFFVGYINNSKAFRVFNSKTRIVEENLHVKFSIKACDNVGKTRVEIGPDKDYILLPPWTQDPPFFSSSKDSPGVGFKPSGEEEKKDAEDLGNKDSEVPSIEEPRVNQEKDASVNITNDINVVSPTNNVVAIEDNDVDKNIVYGFQALKDPSWIEAMQEELLQFKLQEVWNLVELPKGKRAIGTKWVSKNKKDERGIVIKNKVRMVAQEYTQEEGIDYDEGFAPVARYEAIRLFLAYALFKDFMVYQMDVKSAFLYGKIEEEVYVCPPPSFEDLDFPNRVYKVEKALYGLHQAPRAWYKTLPTYLLANRLQRGMIDKSLFKKSDKSDILLVQLYVDDIIFGSTRKEMCTKFEKMMHKKFQTTSMGELIFFLGLQVKQKEDEIFISQEKIHYLLIISKFLEAWVSVWLQTKNSTFPNGMSKHNAIFVIPSHTKKVFRNMKRVGKDFPGRETPLFPTMMVQAQEEMGKEDQWRFDDQEMFDTEILDDEEVVVEKAVAVKEVSAVEEVNAASITTPVSAASTTTIAATTPTIFDKGEGIMVEEPLKMKKKDQISFDKQEAQRKKIKADYEMAQRLQAKEQEQLTDAKKAKLFMKFLERKRKFFAAKRAEEKRNKPPTKAQQRSLMKNMDRWKTRALKNKSFAEIQELFNKPMKRINNFVDFGTELVEESTKKAQAEITQKNSSKRVRDELEQERYKK
nr:hypothetical protein [Tanacetum cinerariifolium]